MIFAFLTLVAICQAQNDIKEKYGVIYESLKDVYKYYTTDVTKTVAFLLLCIGWLATSDKSRDFIRKNKVSRISSIIALVIIGLIHIRTSFNAYVSSQHKISVLSAMDYLDPKYYENYEITIELLIIYLIQNMVLFVLVIAILISLKEVAHNS